ncbi:MAG: Asp-tRNA(Asn)/Glu-tRNA(Gln) amidotransferase subunit GatC [Verrucomicrobiota bacterium]
MSHPVSLTRIAELARLDLTEDELKTYESQIGSILEHIDTLKAINVDDVEPIAHPTPVYDVLRPDEALPGLPPEAFLQNTPDQAQGQLRVPKVVDAG